MKKDIKNLVNLFLSWIVIGFSGLFGMIIGVYFDEVSGYFTASLIATFITLLIWGRKING